jgi:hypothetical protein
LHNVGAKADRDRAVVLHSYEELCRVARIPRAKRLTPFQVAVMTNTQLYQVSKDIYNGLPIKKAQRLAVRLGLVEKPEHVPALKRLRWWLRAQLAYLRMRFVRKGAHA